MKQNVYDNEIFFNSYKQLRDTDNNYNALLEQPAMKKLLPDLNGKTVLDLGCGFGINCMDFVRLGAAEVIGIDISSRMLAVAENENSHSKIKYIHMPIEELDTLHFNCDFVYSSLCFHYIKDFKKLISDIGNILNDNGTVLYSQEHPIVTASAGIHSGYILDTSDKPYAYLISDYHNEGKRTENWFIDGVVKYHRTLSTIINTLCGEGFAIKTIFEPIPDDYALKKREGLFKEFIKPTFLIVKAEKWRV